VKFILLHLRTNNLIKSLLVLLLLTSVPSFSASCGDECSTSTDCTDNSCRYCDPGAFNTCGSCCEFSDLSESECPSPCVWHSGTSQCRNQVGIDCSGIPETPSGKRPILILVFLISGLLAGGLKLKTFLKRSKTQ